MDAYIIYRNIRVAEIDGLFGGYATPEGAERERDLAPIDRPYIHSIHCHRTEG
ncbi:MAG: hypothetical protein ACYC0V_03590 [Armatimonadota bacterium]